MNANQAYAVLREIAQTLGNPGRRPIDIPESPLPDSTLEEIGIDLFAFSDFLEELKQRFHGKTFHLEAFLVPDEFHYLTVGKVISLLSETSDPAQKNLEVVYVDDEEENLFIFRRKFGKDLNLKTFANPIEALDHIRKSSNIGLVITDEVMPKLSGNQLCDEVRKTKPNMKFILITGNPNQDEDLLYKSLRQNRFYELINKPMDLESKGKEYLSMIKALLGAD